MIVRYLDIQDVKYAAAFVIDDAAYATDYCDLRGKAKWEGCIGRAFSETS